MSKDRFCNIAAENDQLVFGTNKNKVVLLNANTGEVIWIQQLYTKVQSAPIFGDTVIFVGSYGGDFGAKYTLTCLNRENGQILWDKKNKNTFWK